MGLEIDSSVGVISPGVASRTVHVNILNHIEVPKKDRGFTLVHVRSYFFEESLTSFLSTDGDTINVNELIVAAIYRHIQPQESVGQMAVLLMDLDVDVFAKEEGDPGSGGRTWGPITVTSPFSLPGTDRLRRAACFLKRNDVIICSLKSLKDVISLNTVIQPININGSTSRGTHHSGVKQVCEECGIECMCVLCLCLLPTQGSLGGGCDVPARQRGGCRPFQ